MIVYDTHILYQNPLLIFPGHEQGKHPANTERFSFGQNFPKKKEHDHEKAPIFF